MKYSTWKTWFITSVISFLIIFMIMTLPNTKQVEELPYVLAVSFINLGIAIYYGFKHEIKNL